MALEQELLEEGFEAYGPVAESDLPEAVREQISRHSGTLSQIRIIRGGDAREDMQDYKHLYMVYSLNIPYPPERTKHSKVE